MIDFEPLELRQLMSFGALDATFGAGGQAAPDPSGYVAPQKTLVQSDGRIVVAGETPDWALRRYMPDGTIDRSFGDDGTLRIGALLKASDDIELLAETADGGLFIGGRAKLHDETFKGERTNSVLIAKLTPGGMVDESFLDDGASNVGQAGFFRVGGRRDSRNDFVKALRNGKLLVASGDDHQRITLTRFNANGRLDSAFGNNGSASGVNVPIPITPIEPPGKLPLSYRSSSGIISLAEAPDGSVVGLGYYVYARGNGAWGSAGPYTAASLPYFVRFGSTGEVLNTRVYTPDINKAQTSRYSGLSIHGFRGMTIAPDGKIYVLAHQAVMRFNADFSLDVTWGGDGIASPTVTIHGQEYPANIADLEFQADGKVLGVVSAILGGAAHVDEPILVRFNSDGSTQASVVLGVAPSPPAGGVAGGRKLNTVERSRDGRLLVAGENVPLTRVFCDDATAGFVNGGAALDADETDDGYALDITWHDDDAEAVSDAAPLNPGALEITTPAGRKLTARAVSRMQNPDGSVRVHYRAGPARAAAAAQPGTEQGHYTVHFLTHRIADITAALAAGRTLGAFTVRVPEPLLTTASVATSFSRERQRLAPNT